VWFYELPLGSFVCRLDQSAQPLALVAVDSNPGSVEPMRRAGTAQALVEHARGESVALYNVCQ
jgi:hypothetical protein